MKISLLLFALFATTSAVLPAQMVSFGLKGGYPGLSSSQSPRDESTIYILGVSGEFQLPSNFAFEIDALYTRPGSSGLTRLPGAPSYLLSTGASRDRADSWQFPAILKYYVGSHDHAVQPFVGLGSDFRISHFIFTGTGTELAGNSIVPVSFRYKFIPDPSFGTVASVGVRMHYKRFGIIPEARYIRWDYSDGLLKNNEVDAMLGITF